MARRIFGGILVVLSALFLVSSVLGIGAIWYYKERVTNEVTGQLKEVDNQLAQAEATLASSEKELQRALRIVDAAQTAVEKLTEQTQGAGTLLERIQSTLDDRLLPELKTTRTRLETARTSLENLQSVLKGVGSFIPGLDLNGPDKVLTDLITSARSLDVEINNVELLATQASTFVGDTSFLLGGDLTETRTSLQTFVTTIQDYEKRVSGWRKQDQDWLAKAPKWIDQASIILTVFLVWFSLSQYVLLLYGINLQRGGDPLMGLRRERLDNPLMKNPRDLELEE